MDFRLWLEKLELKSTEVSPISDYLRFDRNNPQEVQSIQNRYTARIWQFPLAKDYFIHFTLSERVEEILRAKELGPRTDTGDGYNVFAVSCSFGIWFPIVQFNHIITKKKERVVSPLELRTGKSKKMLERGYRMPNFGQEIAAIRFRTNKVPDVAHSEEVVWHGTVPLIEASAITTREAVNILKHSQYKISEQDTVQYH